MTDQISFPPLRDLPGGHHEARKQHLLTEIGREAKPRRRLPSLSWTPFRVAGVASAIAAAAAIAVALVPSSGGRGPVRQHAASPPLYSIHASVTATSRDDRHFSPSGLKPIGDHGISFTGDSVFSRKQAPRAVLVLAAAQAHAFGNRGPTLVQWVKTTRQKAVSAENAGRVDGSSLPIYFVILHGHFVDYATPRPPGAKSPRGRILTNTIEIKTGRALDFGITNSEPDISKIGKPHHFVIYGHRSSR